jgi:hypothetical protein
MGFLDKARAAATELAARADEALTTAGAAGPGVAAKAADRHFRDLGVLAYLQATGRPVDESERARLMTALQGFETQGAIPGFALQTAPPPPPGAVAAGYAVPPPPSGYGTPPPPAAAPPPPPGAAAAPPPPPAQATPTAYPGAGMPSAQPSVPPPPPPPPGWGTTP